MNSNKYCVQIVQQSVGAASCMCLPFFLVDKSQPLAQNRCAPERDHIHTSHALPAHRLEAIDPMQRKNYFSADASAIAQQASTTLLRPLLLCPLQQQPMHVEKMVNSSSQQQQEEHKKSNQNSTNHHKPRPRVFIRDTLYVRLKTRLRRPTDSSL